MSIITRCRKHTAVYWEFREVDGEGGLSFKAPVEISCRWDDDQVRQVLETGDEFLSNSQVICDRVVHVGDYFFLGALTDIVPANERDPRNVQGAHQCRHVARTPKLRNPNPNDPDKTLITAYL